MDNTQPENNSAQGGAQSKNKHTGLIMAVILILALGAIVFLYKPDTANNVQNNQFENQEQQNVENDNKVVTTPAQSETIVTPTATTMTTQSAGEIKIFNVDGDNFSFSLKEIKVKKGDTVKIIFNNTMGFHDWVIDEFSAKTPQLEAGKSATVEFVADKTGSFEYYCSVGKHRQMGMVGKLIVE